MTCTMIRFTPRTTARRSTRRTRATGRAGLILGSALLARGLGAQASQPPAAAPLTRPRASHDSSAAQFRARPVAATHTAHRAIAQSGTAVRGRAPARLDAGRVLVVPFGDAQPVVATARLRVSVVELEPGEVVVDPPITADTVRWVIRRAAAGPDGGTPLVVIKPTDCDLTTNLVIPTDRRIYHLTLDSPPCGGAAARTTNPRDPYVRHVRFTYAGPARGGTVRTPAAPTVYPAPNSTASASSGPLADAARLRFGYRVKKDRRFPWAPAEVYDDGARVYIRLPDEARHAEAPALFVLEADGRRTLVNYTLAGGSTYVTDRLFDRAVLVSSDGRSERTLVIERPTDGGGGR